MADNLGFTLQAKLDEVKSGQTIEAQLAVMGQKMSKLDIGFNIDIPKVTKQFNGLVQVLESHIGTAGDSLNEVFSTTRIKQYKDTLGNTVKDYQQLNKEGTEFETKNRTITENAEKQKSILEQQYKTYQKIKITLDGLPNQFKGSSATQDLYSMLDASENLGDLKTLQDLTENYYKECISLDKQYQDVKNSNNKETIQAFKNEKDKVDFIYQKRKQLLDLEKQINNLANSKGVNTGNYSAEIDTLRSSLAGYSTTGTSLYPEQKQEIVQIVDELKQKLQLEKDSLNVQYQQENAQVRINNARQNLNDIVSKNGTYDVNQYALLNKSITSLESGLKDGSLSAQKFRLEMNKLSPEMKQFETEARKASASTSTLSSRFKRFLSFYSFYDVLQTGKLLIREVSKEILELDNSILEVNKILNLSTNEMDKFVSKAYEMGESISRTGRDAVDAVGVMVKAGFSDIDQALGFAKLALSMKNVGDNMNDVERNANVLISTMKGYGNESVQFAENTLNVLNEVSNTSAITFSDLAESYTRTSAVYAQAGVSIEKLAGLVTGSNEIIQNIEKSSSGLLIISQRLRQVTAGFEEDPENLSRLDTALQKVANVDIQDSTGQLRDTYSILTDIAEVYPTLTKNEQAYLGELIAGKRQISVFQALMANWEKVEKATQSATNSAGSYMKEQEAYFNSISGHLARLESAWQSLATNSLDSSIIKNLIDMVTWIVKLTDACGGLQIAVLGLITSFIAFKVILKVDFLKNIITQFSLLAKTAQVAGVSITALTLAGKLLIGAGVVAGIMAIGYGINYISKAGERAKEVVTTLSTELKGLQDKSASVGSLGKQFDDLKGIERTVEQQKEFLDTQNQLRDLLPNISGFYNAQGNFIVDTTEDVNSLTKALDKLIKKQQEQLSKASEKTSQYTINDYEKAKKQLAELAEYSNLKNEYFSKGLSAEDEKRYFSLHNSLNAAGLDIEKEISEYQALVTTSLLDMQSNIRNQIMSSEDWDKLGEDAKNGILKSLSEVKDYSLVKFSEDITNGDMSVKTLLHTLSNTQSFADYIKGIEDSKAKTNELEDSVTTLSSTLEKLSGTRSNIEKLQSILSNLDDGGLSASDMEELLGISEEFLPYLNDEIALREKLTESVNGYKDQYKQDYYEIIKTSQEYYNARIKGDTDLHNTLSNNVEQFFNGLGIAYTDDFANYTDLENGKAKLTEKIVAELAGTWATYFDSFGDIVPDKLDDRYGSGGTGGILGEEKTISATVLKIKNAKDKLNKIITDSTYEPININFDSKDSSSASSASKEAEKELSEIEKLYEAFNKRIKDKEFQISLLDFNGGEDATSKQIEIYKQMQSEVHSLAEKARKLGISENDEYIQNLKTQWIGYSNDIGDLITSSYEKQNQAIEDSLKLLDVEQSKYKTTDTNYKNITDQKYNLILQQEELLKKKVAELYKAGYKNEAEELEKTFVDLYQTRIELAKEYQSIETDNLQSQIETLEEQKSAIESLHDMTMQMIKDELNARKKQYEDEINDIEKVFDAKKKSIQDAEDLRSYNKDLSEKTTVVANLENQLAIIKNDETVIAKRKQLEDELVKAKDELDEYQRDHSVELQEDALDKQLELETDKLQSEIDKIDDTLSNEVKLRELADKRITKSGEKLKNQLIANAKEYGSFTVEEVSNAWDTAGEAVDSFNDKQKGLLGTLKEISQELIDTQKQLKEVEKLSTDDYASSIGKPTTSTNKESTITKMQSNSEAWNRGDAQEKKRLFDENQKLGKALGLIYDSQTGAWFYDKEKKLRVYHEGGKVGGSNYATNSMNQLFNLLKSDEEIAKLQKGEGVITSSHADKIMGMISNNNTNNSETFSPTFMFNFEGQPSEILLGHFKEHGKEIAKMVFGEMEKSDARMGIKRNFKTI